MRKFLFAAALAAVSVPAHAAFMTIDVDFGPTTTGPAAAGIHFEAEWEILLNDWESMGRARLAIFEPIMGPFDYGDFAFAPNMFITRGFAFNTHYYKLAGNILLRSGEVVEVLFALDENGNALVDFPPEFNGIHVLTPGSVWTERYHWTDPDVNSVVFDPSIFSSPVPEPATWAMLIGGLTLVGAQMRRRKVSVSFA